MCTRLIEGGTLRFGTVTAAVFNGVFMIYFLVNGITTHKNMAEYNEKFGMHYANEVVVRFRLLLSFQITYFTLSFLTLPCLIFGVTVKYHKHVFIMMALVIIGAKIFIETGLLIALSGLTSLWRFVDFLFFVYELFLWIVIFYYFVELRHCTERSQR